MKRSTGNSGLKSGVLQSWGAWAVELFHGPSVGLSSVLLVALLGICWLTAVSSGSAVAVSRHLFYVPVLYTAVRFGSLPTVAVGTFAGLLAGPLVPLPEEAAARNTLGVWGVRLAFLVVVGVITAVMVELARRGIRAQQHIAQREAEVAVSKGLFIQAVSHELRTPLTTIHGGIELLAQGHHDQAQIRRLCDVVRHGAQRLTMLVENVLAASGALGMRVQRPIDLDVMIAGLFGDSQDDLARIDFRLDADARQIVSSPAHLRLVLHAIISNALKFSPSKSPVIVTAVRLDRDRVRIQVHDSGPGIPDDILKAGTAPFTTTSRHEGLGMGLFVARKMTEELAGTLRFAPAPDGGTVVTIELPHVGERDPATPASAHARGPF